MLRGLRLATVLWLCGLGLCLGAPPAAALTVEEVIELLESGVGEAVIREQIEADGQRIVLGADEILSLKEAGATDELIRAMIRTGRNRGATGSRGEILDDLEDRSASPGIRVRLYYDPFGYHWYPWRWAYAYYDPFPWFDCGFYYAGWWDCRWWRWGSWCVDARSRYCDGWPGRWHGRDSRWIGEGRNAWSRDTRSSAHGRPPADRTGRRFEPGPERRRADRAVTRSPATRPPGSGDRAGWRNPGRGEGPGRSGGSTPSRPAGDGGRPPRSGWHR